MRYSSFALVVFALFALSLVGVRIAAAPEEHKLDAQMIGTAAGTKPTTSPDGVVRIAWARTDVKVQVDGMPLKPFAGLGAWAAFTAAPHGAMVMGDTVVFQDEVSPAMDAATHHFHSWVANRLTTDATRSLT